MQKGPGPSFRGPFFFVGKRPLKFCNRKGGPGGFGSQGRSKGGFGSRFGGGFGDYGLPLRGGVEPEKGSKRLVGSMRTTTTTTTTSTNN